MTSSNYFRPKLKYWFDEIIGPFVIIPAVLTACIIGIRLLLNSNDSRLNILYVLSVLLWVVCVPAFILFSYWSWKTYLDFTDEKLSGYFRRTKIEILWSEVIAARLIQAERQERFLLLGTHQGTIVIPLKYFDDEIVWEKCQMYVPEEAWGEKAYQRLPEIQALTAARDALLDSQTSLKVSTPSLGRKIIRVVGICFTALFFYLVWEGEISGRWAIAPYIAALVSGAFLIPGWIEMDSEGIVRTDLRGRFYIAWNDIVRVEISLDRDRMVFIGSDKSLVITGAGNWRGRDKKQMLELLGAQIDRKKIEWVETWRAAFRVTKNSRIERN